MHSPTPLSRRAVVKTLGAGLAVLPCASTVAAAAAAGTPQPFTLPALPYAYNALEPHFDARTMEIHHSKHHQAYITSANAALASHPALRARSAEELVKDLAAVPEAIRTAVRNHVGGHLNHALFWDVIAPRAGGAPTGPLAAALQERFGSLDAFRAQFADAAMKRFGSGWAWLTLKGGRLEVTSTANQDSPLMEGAIPLLGLDVWEHAYYLQYQNRRADFVAAFWNVVSWDRVAARYAAAR
jgi:Fe-Mn family superoxide dismutase